MARPTPSWNSPMRRDRLLGMVIRKHKLDAFEAVGARARRSDRKSHARCRAWLSWRRTGAWHPSIVGPIAMNLGLPGQRRGIEVTSLPAQAVHAHHERSLSGLPHPV